MPHLEVQPLVVPPLAVPPSVENKMRLSFIVIFEISIQEMFESGPNSNKNSTVGNSTQIEKMIIDSAKSFEANPAPIFFVTSISKSNLIDRVKSK